MLMFGEKKELPVVRVFREVWKILDTVVGLRGLFSLDLCIKQHHSHNPFPQRYNLT